ncbi:MAG: class I SAM-dependent methyltransferase [Alphaproteobacteria bacterium]|nr:class I SAM-dependent methyltransferase [Alphaproteobacteria bacterium]
MAPFPKDSSFLKGAGQNVSDKNAQRMIERHKKIIDANIPYIKGKRILDLAAHNGRWTYAALQAGAKSVFAIEGRQELIDRGLPDFKDIDPKRYTFACGDIYDMREIVKKHGGPDTFDTVFCLGIFYHVTDHYRLLRLMTSFNPECIILDTGSLKTDEAVIKFRLEDSEDPSMAIRERAEEQMSLSGVASWGFIKLAAKLNGYDVTRIKWKPNNVEYREAIDDYMDYPENQARRITVRLTKKAAK